MILGVFSYTRERILNIHQRVIFCKFFLLKNLLYFLYSYSEQRSLISSETMQEILFAFWLYHLPKMGGRFRATHFYGVTKSLAPIWHSCKSTSS